MYVWKWPGAGLYSSLSTNVAERSREQLQSSVWHRWDEMLEMTHLPHIQTSRYHVQQFTVLLHNVHVNGTHYQWRKAHRTINTASTETRHQCHTTRRTAQLIQILTHNGDQFGAIYFNIFTTSLDQNEFQRQSNQICSLHGIEKISLKVLSVS